MKKTHILNIGYPKCGTTWLWDTLVHNKSIAFNHVKENLSLVTGTTVDNYCKQYLDDVTANFNTSTLIVDRYVIEQLSHHPQIKVSFIIREPVDLLWSLYNFMKVDNVDYITYCYHMYDTKLFTHPDLIVSRWKTYFGNRFNLFWYDDLTQDNESFYHDYCKKMELDPGPGQMLDKTNVTSYKHTMPCIDNDLADLLKLQFQKVLVYK